MRWRRELRQKSDLYAVVMYSLPLSDVREHLGALVRRVASSGERVTITDRGRPVAVIVSAQELADLDDGLALARHDARRARDEVTFIRQDDVRRRLGIARS